MSATFEREGISAADVFQSVVNRQISDFLFKSRFSLYIPGCFTLTFCDILPAYQIVAALKGMKQHIAKW